MGDADGALADFDQAIRLKPDGAAAFLERGSARLGQKEWAKSIEDFGRFIQLERRNPAGFYMRSLAHTGLGNYGDAIVDLEEALRLVKEWGGDDDLEARYESALGKLRKAQTSREA